MPNALLQTIQQNNNSAPREVMLTRAPETYNLNAKEYLAEESLLSGGLNTGRGSGTEGTEAALSSKFGGIARTESTASPAVDAAPSLTAQGTAATLTAAALAGAQGQAYAQLSTPNLIGIPGTLPATQEIPQPQSVDNRPGGSGGERGTPTTGTPDTNGPDTDGPGTDGPGTDGPGTDGPGTDNPGNPTGGVFLQLDTDLGLFQNPNTPLDLNLGLTLNPPYAPVLGPVLDPILNPILTSLPAVDLNIGLAPQIPALLQPITNPVLAAVSPLTGSLGTALSESFTIPGLTNPVLLANNLEALLPHIPAVIEGATETVAALSATLVTETVPQVLTGVPQVVTNATQLVNETLAPLTGSDNLPPLVTEALQTVTGTVDAVAEDVLAPALEDVSGLVTTVAATWPIFAAPPIPSLRWSRNWPKPLSLPSATCSSIYLCLSRPSNP